MLSMKHNYGMNFSVPSKELWRININDLTKVTWRQVDSSEKEFRR
jgi:hypothetical protein